MRVPLNSSDKCTKMQNSVIFHGILSIEKQKHEKVSSFHRAAFRLHKDFSNFSILLWPIKGVRCVEGC